MLTNRTNNEPKTTKHALGLRSCFQITKRGSERQLKSNSSCTGRASQQLLAKPNQNERKRTKAKQQNTITKTNAEEFSDAHFIQVFCCWRSLESFAVNAQVSEPRLQHCCGPPAALIAALMDPSAHHAAAKVAELLPKPLLHQGPADSLEARLHPLEAELGPANAKQGPANAKLGGGFVQIHLSVMGWADRLSGWDGWMK